MHTRRGEVTDCLCETAVSRSGSTEYKLSRSHSQSICNFIIFCRFEKKKIQLFSVATDWSYPTEKMITSDLVVAMRLGPPLGKMCVLV